MADREEAKRLILQIVAIAGGRLDGTSRLNKAFYAAHLIYWKEQHGVLTDYPIVKLDNGPGIDDYLGLIDELVAEGNLDAVSETRGPYEQTTLILKTPVVIDPRDSKFDSIRRAVDWVNAYTTPELSRITHDRPSYRNQPRIGHEQAIYLDVLSDDEYDRVRAACEEVDDAFRIALER